MLNSSSDTPSADTTILPQHDCGDDISPRNHTDRCGSHCRSTIIHSRRVHVPHVRTQLIRVRYMILFIFFLVGVNHDSSSCCCVGYNIPVITNRNKNIRPFGNTPRISTATYSTTTSTATTTRTTGTEHAATAGTLSSHSVEFSNRYQNDDPNDVMKRQHDTHSISKDESMSSSSTATTGSHNFRTPNHHMVVSLWLNRKLPLKHSSSPPHDPMSMIHQVLRQTSRIATTAAACSATSDRPSSVAQDTIPLQQPQKSMIKTTIDSVLLRSRQQNQNSDSTSLALQPSTLPRPSPTTVVVDPTTNHVLKTAAFSATDIVHHPLPTPKQPMGIIVSGSKNDDATITTTSGSQNLASSSTSLVSNHRHPDILIHEENTDPETQQNTITQVRFARPQDDMDVAYLRMSVFSDMMMNSYNDQSQNDLIRSHFCTRSCQAMASRRLRGAVCFVATTTRIPSAMSPHDNNHVRTEEIIEDDPHEIVVGSIECSYHEFFHTRLGARRKQYALLYITEVAVHSSVRRRGMGTKLLNAVERYATQLGSSFVCSNDNDEDENVIESLYLHVDVSNRGAIRMYEQCGYYKVLSNDPIYTEFTTGLNLQPGATRGREHYLLCKDLVPNPVWLSSHHGTNNGHENPRTTTTHDDDTNRQPQQRHPILSRLGIEIPA